MDVLQLSKFYPPELGGIESTVRELTEGLNRLGVRTDVLCANTRNRSETETRGGGYRVTRAASMGSVLSMSAAPSLIPLLRRLGPSYGLVHVHMPDPMAALALWCARAGMASHRVVVHWHSDVVRQRVALRLYQPLQAWVLARADAVVATSAAYAESSDALSRWRGKVCVVPIGIGDNHAQATAEGVRSVRARCGGRRIVFALGRFAHYKGFDVLVEAASGLADDVAVLIGGGGGDARLRQQLQRRVGALGLAGRVQVLGRIDDEQLANYFAACDVFCLPSTDRAEAFGIAQVEAMCMGRPVVSTHVEGSGVSWINQHGVTGLTVPAREPVALRQALNTLLADDALRARMGAAGRQRYLAEFDAPRMTQRIAQLYQRLGADAPRPNRKMD